MGTYTLFNGRHEMPANEGAICESFDFVSKTVVKTPLWDKAIYSDEEVTLYVTGLTPALTQFISEWVKHNAKVACDSVVNGRWVGESVIFEAKLTLMHYDSASGQYWPQVIA